MKTQIIIVGLMLMLPFMGSAQKTNKFTTPRAKITMVQNGMETSLNGFTYGKTHTIKVELEGGVENVDHKMYVTSRHAVVTSLGNGIYEVTPVSKENVELIVDLQTFEDFQFYEMKPQGKKKKIKKVLSTYPPRKYMVAFERYNVNM